MRRVPVILIILVGLLGHACIEPIDLKSIRYENLLVVEGHISNVNKPQQIKLSRTAPLNEEVFIAETGADVSVESASGEKIQFSEVKPGIYESPSFSGIVGEGYTLSITTSNGRKYMSEQVVLKDVPPIGRIYAEFVTAPDRGIKISVDTEDPINNTHFYRWNYTETYEVQTPYPSNYWVPPGTDSVVWRYDRIDTCWPSDTLRDVLIKGTRSQAQDKVIAFPLRFIPENSYIFRIKYSMLVTQYALSEQAYSYWDNIKIINEGQGTFSDIQPGTIISNVIGITNPSETVLGYFDASAVSEKRVFFNYKDFEDDGYVQPTFRSNCYEIPPIIVPESEFMQYMELHGDNLIIWESLGFWPFTELELLPTRCCDCTDLGTPVKPLFWE